MPRSSFHRAIECLLRNDNLDLPRCRLAPFVWSEVVDKVLRRDNRIDRGQSPASHLLLSTSAGILLVRSNRYIPCNPQLDSKSAQRWLFPTHARPLLGIANCACDVSFRPSGLVIRVHHIGVICKREQEFPYDRIKRPLIRATKFPSRFLLELAGQNIRVFAQTPERSAFMCKQSTSKIFVSTQATISHTETAMQTEAG